jgi:hypothetical protein
MDSIQKKLSPNDANLSVGIDEFIKGIQYQNPQMSNGEIETLGNALLGQAGKALQNGERLASVKLKPDGNFDIDIWHTGPRKEG